MGPIVQAASGALGAVTFSQTRAGQVLGVRPQKPTTPTASQALRRAQFSVFRIGWRSLTADQRKQWDSFARAVPAVNRVGIASRRSGFQWYCSHNMSMKAAGLAYTATPPWQFRFPALPGGEFFPFWSIPGPTDSFYITYTGASFTTPTRYIAYSDPSVRRYPSPYSLDWKIFDTGVMTASPLYLTPGSWVAKFGEANTTAFVPCAIRLLAAGSMAGPIVYLPQP